MKTIEDYYEVTIEKWEENIELRYYIIQENNK